MELIEVNASNGDYSIFIENGISKKLKSFTSDNLFIITDDNVFNIYQDLILGITKDIIVVEPGESSKSIEVIERIYKTMHQKGVTRSHTIVSIGGGVIGDIAGFVASTFNRGLKWINIPTTLLSQVDSSIGGKTGINFMGIKNYIGSFYQPSLVLIDPLFLDTLNKREFSNGIAEVIKAGCIKNPEILSLCEEFRTDQFDIDLIIKKSLLVKKYYVENDPLDQNIRTVLNFGHTIGHAIESSTDLLHGESIAFAISKIIKSECIDQLLGKFDLPIKCNYNIEEIAKIMKYDKKSDGSNISFVLVKNLGKAVIEKRSIEEIIDYLRWRYE